jgi:hypothetical protein
MRRSIFTRLWAGEASAGTKANPSDASTHQESVPLLVHGGHHQDAPIGGGEDATVHGDDFGGLTVTMQRIQSEGRQLDCAAAAVGPLTAVVDASTDVSPWLARCGVRGRV